AGQAQNFGTVELREAAELPFERFRALVLQRNQRGTLRSDGPSSYVTSDGRAIQFDVFSPLELWPIIAIDGVARERRFERWPLAEGDVINAKGDGLITVDNPFRGERLTLDAREPLRPVRQSEVKHQDR